MKFVLLLFIGIHCLSVSQSKSKCPKKDLDAMEKKYLFCLDGLIRTFYRQAFKYPPGYVEVPQYCRTALKRINKECYKRKREQLVKYCKNKNITERAFENYNNAVNEALEFTCRDKIDFYYATVGKTEKMDCQVPYLEIYNCQQNHPLATLTGNYSDSFCRNGAEGLKCINEALTTNKCNSVLIKTVNKFYEALRNNTPCANSN